jgi:nudix-type nucleoside diphosphatase (YffH/AdpP family)
MIEACAGVLDEKDPEKCVIREAREETGYEISSATKIFECYMSPGAVTELIYFYISYYTDDMKKDKGGGLDEEHEDIEVLEIPFEKAYGMIKTGEIKDGKTVMLLQYAKIEIFI